MKFRKREYYEIRVDEFFFDIDWEWKFELGWFGGLNEYMMIEYSCRNYYGFSNNVFFWF